MREESDERGECKGVGGKRIRRLEYGTRDRSRSCQKRSILANYTT